MNDPKHIVAVAGVFFNTHRQVLLVRTERRGWECPGGQVEEGEDLVAALVREVQEETGCVVEVERLVGIYTNPTPPSKVMFTFVGKYVSGVASQGDEQEVGWYTKEQALQMVTHHANRLKLQDALNENERPVYRVYTTNPYELRLQSTW